MTYQKQPDPSAPGTRLAPPPSLLSYLVMVALAAALVTLAFVKYGPDWSGLLINLASGVITAVVLLIVLERKIREDEIGRVQLIVTSVGVRVQALVFPDVAATVQYAKVFEYQVRSIRPEEFVEATEQKKIVDRPLTSFILYGPAGVGKTTVVQEIASHQARVLALHPRNGRIPVYVPLRTWTHGGILEKIQAEIRRYYPVKNRLFREWVMSGRLLLVFDGLDEALQPDDVMDDIERLGQLVPGVVTIVTSRPRAPIRKSTLPAVELGPSSADYTHILYRRLMESSSEELAQSLDRMK